MLFCAVSVLYFSVFVFAAMMVWGVAVLLLYAVYKADKGLLSFPRWYRHWCRRW